MSQQYYYNGTQYTLVFFQYIIISHWHTNRTPTTYSAQTVNNLYTGVVAQPLTSGYTAASTGRTAYTVSGTQISSAHRSQAPVSYTYPTNATGCEPLPNISLLTWNPVIAPPVAVVPSQQATIVAPPLPPGKVNAGGTSYVIANGPTSNINTNGAYTGIPHW